MEITREEYEFLKSIVNRYERTTTIDPIESMTIKEYYYLKNSVITRRIYTCLVCNHIYKGNEKIDLKTMEQLKSLSRMDFMRLKMFGKVAMSEVEFLFESLGWELKDNNF
jgi:hypothetical protein